VLCVWWERRTASRILDKGLAAWPIRVQASARVAAGQLEGVQQRKGLGRSDFRRTLSRSGTYTVRSTIQPNYLAYQGDACWASIMENMPNWGLMCSLFAMDPQRQSTPNEAVSSTSVNKLSAVPRAVARRR
jgi:hypothetical protein